MSVGRSLWSMTSPATHQPRWMLSVYCGPSALLKLMRVPQVPHCKKSQSLQNGLLPPSPQVSGKNFGDVELSAARSAPGRRCRRNPGSPKSRRHCRLRRSACRRYRPSGSADFASRRIQEHRPSVAPSWPVTSRTVMLPLSELATGSKLTVRSSGDVLATTFWKDVAGTSDCTMPVRIAE